MKCDFFANLFLVRHYLSQDIRIIVQELTLITKTEKHER